MPIINSSRNLYNESVRLVLTDPTPILRTLSAFKKGCVPRLKADGADLGIYSFTLEAPKNEIGTRLSVSLTSQNLSNASLSKKYDFSINAKNLPGDADNWKTLISNADLDSRNVGIRFRGDNLALSVISPAEDVLRMYPVESNTIYDPDKTDFDTSQVEPMKTESGAIIPYTTTAQRGLHLYHALERVAERTGLASITTSIPNYEIARFDTSVLSSFRDSLAHLFGVFNTLWLAEGDEIKIINRSQIVPEEFEVFELTVDKFLSWQMEMPSSPRRDGFAVSYVDSSLDADEFEIETIEPPDQPSGTFGSSDYQVIETVQTFKRWFNSEFPDVTLRRDLVTETRTTKAPIPPYTVTLSTIAVFSIEHTYDLSGKRIGSTHEHETRIPDVEDEGTIILTKTSEVRQTVNYTVDPRNPRRFLPFQIVTYRDGLIAVDEENPYINPETGEEEAYRQDYALLHRTGSLLFDGSQTKEFGPISQTTETLQWLGGDQYQSTVSTIYYVSGMQSEPISEPKAGDPSVSATSGKQRTVYIYRNGYTEPENGLGYGFETKSGGEVPLRFLIPEMKIQLAERFTKKQTGTVEIGGFSESVGRGALLIVKDRAGVSYGRFIVEGFTVTGNRLERGGWQLTTRLDVAEI